MEVNINSFFFLLLTNTSVFSMQWIDSALKQGQEVEFFHDEFRCPVYVKDVANVIIALSKKWISGCTFQLVFCFLLKDL